MVYQTHVKRSAHQTATLSAQNGKNYLRIFAKIIYRNLLDIRPNVDKFIADGLHNNPFVVQNLASYHSYALTHRTQSRVLRYSIAVVSVVVVTILHKFIDPHIAIYSPFLPYTFAIIVSAGIGGLGPGMLATLLSGIATVYFYIDPVNTFKVGSAQNNFILLIFLLVGFLISILNEILQISYRRMAIILESINDAFLIVNTRWEITYINPQAEKIMLGRTREEIINHNIWKTFPGLRGTLAEKKYIRAMHSHKPVTFEEYYPRSSRWLEYHMYPSPEGLSVICSDVTARKLLEKRKDDFMMIASHELKTPLTSIKTFAQILERQMQKKSAKQSSYFVIRINEQINRLIKLVDDLLDVNKIATGKLAYDKKYFSIDELIKEIIIDFQHTDHEHIIERMGETNKKIFADRDRIGQVLINLIANATKYSQSDAKIIVSEKSTKDTIVVSVRDFGIGIAKENLPRIFDRFFQVSEKKAGLGMGLFIASQIVKRHNGKLWVESQKGKGSTFSFSLPLRKP